jgi:hypothetical protein
MKIHTLAATDTQTNIREVLTQTVQRRFSLRLRRLIGYTALLSLGTMGVSASWADNCTGYDAGVTQSAETTDLGHGLKQTSVRSTSMLFTNDSMYNLVGGECAATVLQTEDGKTQQMGYCARHDKDGDTQSVSFQQAPGADKGEWKSTGGTGKFAGKGGSGWFQTVLMDGKNSVVKWGGDCH